MRPASPPRSEAEEIEQLRAIAYLAASEPAGGSRGVTRHDPQRSAPGLNLVTSGHGPVAFLMAMNGEVFHEWRAESAQVFPDRPKFERAEEARRNFWHDTILFPNGDIVVIWELFGIFKLDPDSRPCEQSQNPLTTTFSSTSREKSCTCNPSAR